MKDNTAGQSPKAGIRISQVPTFRAAEDARAWLDRQITSAPWITNASLQAERAEARDWRAKVDALDADILLRWDALARGDRSVARLLTYSGLLDDLLEAPCLRSTVAAIRSQLEAELPERSARRRAERALADYIESDVLPHCDSPYEASALAAKIEHCHACRMEGCIFSKDGAPRIAWNYKCGNAKLDPDEAREETMRLAAHYAPEMQRWAAEARSGTRRRVFFAVFTWPHAAPGKLHDQLRLLPQLVRERFINARRPATDADRERLGRPRLRIVPRFAAAVSCGIDGLRDSHGPGLHGGLLNVEAPLSAAGRWNVHVNALLLWEGRCDFAEIYQAWSGGDGHRNVELREVNARDPAALARAIIETIKYAAAHTGAKSASKAAAGASPAPPMTAWPGARWLEWWRAHTGFRRTRAFGCLYNLPPPEEEPPAEGQYIGRIVFADCGTYWVDLIPDHKSAGSAWSEEGTTTWSTGPPRIRAGPEGT